MKILEYSVPENYELILFGDSHEGSALQFREGYIETIQYILDGKNRYCLHMGDEMEAFWIDDPRYRPSVLEKEPLAQQNQVIYDLMPLARDGKLITILYGNHSHKLYPKVGDITEDTCSKLSIQYGGFSCVVRFIDKYGLQFNGFFTHGRKLIKSVADDPVRNLANLQLQLKQHLKYKMGDCLLMAKAHTHRLIVCDPRSQLYLTTNRIESDRNNWSNLVKYDEYTESETAEVVSRQIDEFEILQHYTRNPPFGKGGYVHPDHRWYANTGSFLRTFSEEVISYSEIGEYDPVELGLVIVEVNDRSITGVRKVVV